MKTDVVIIVSIYFLSLLGWSLYNFIKNYKKQGNVGDSLYVGDRSYGAGPLLATLVAAWASSYTLLASSESGFNFGVSGPIWYAIGVAVPVIIFIWPINLITKIRSFVPNGVTIIQFIEKRYDEKTRLAGLVIVFISSILYVINVVMAVGIILSSLLNISVVTATLIGGIILVIYSALGGFEAIIWTHVYQLVLAGLAIIVALIFTIKELGISTLTQNIVPDQMNALAWGPLEMSDFFFVMLAFTVANPIVWQRIFSAKNSESATRAFKWFGPTFAPFAIGAGLIGMAAFQIMPDINPSQSATIFAISLFPNWAAIVFLLGSMALIFSSGDAAINNVASIVQIDIIKKYIKKEISPRKNLLLGFALQIVLGVVGILGALKFTSILDLLILNGAFNLALLLPLYLGLVWTGAKSNAAFWSILISLLTGIFTLKYGPISNLTVILVSALIFIGMSYMLNKERKLPKSVFVTIISLLLYSALVFITYFNNDLVLQLPEFIMYILYALTVLGSLGILFVLPVIILKNAK